MSDIKLPDLGEGVSGGIVTALSVKAGDLIQENDPIIEIETDKAVLPVPSPTSGTVGKILVAEGDKIDVGQVIATMEASDGQSETESKEEDPSSSADESQADKSESRSPDTSKSTGTNTRELEVALPDLGEGVAGGIVTSIVAQPGTISEGDPIIEIETDKAVLPVPSPASGELKEVVVKEGEKIDVGQKIALMIAEVSGQAGGSTSNVSADHSAETHQPTPSAPKAPKLPPNRAAASSRAPSSLSASIPAGPAARKFARELGIELNAVEGSGRGGRIRVEDVKAHVKGLNLGSKKSVDQKTPDGGGAALQQNWPALPDFGKFGSVRREKTSNLRSIIGERMSMCWNRIPHVFQFNEVDLTALARIQGQYKDDFKAKGSSVSPTNFIIKAMAICLREFPQFNASFDESKGEIIYKDYVNIGVAVDTPTGLIVPVLKNVDQQSIFDIGKNLKELAKRTRDRKVSQDDLSGGSMTLSNLGGIGGTHFTPIINWPEVAILGVGRSEKKPKFIDGEFVPRDVTQLTLSYDHRVIDGADGARFMVRLTEILENIERTLLGG